jgi:microcystin degradation protein MlrC
MKLAVGQVVHETNTFSNVATNQHRFEEWEWLSGEAFFAAHQGVRSYVGGMLEQASVHGITLLPTFSAAAAPSGLIPKNTLRDIKHELLSRLRLLEPDIDGVCLALHGAGVAEGVADIEGDILRDVREIVGDKPIVSTLDLHGNVTDAMVEYADVLLGVRFYPHTDMYERGQEAIEVMKAMVAGDFKPVMRLTKPPLMVPTFTSNLPPVKDINEICAGWEQNESLLDCTFFHGFPYTDIPDVRVSVITVSNGDADLAEAAGKDVAKKIWDMRERFNANYPSPAQGIKQALAAAGQPIVINETSDNPGIGAPGDGTYLLRAMIEAQLERACIATIADPQTVKKAHQAGVGSSIEVQLGGKTDRHHGSSVKVKVYVKALTDGKFVISSPMGAGRARSLGLSARLQVGGLDIIVSSLKGQLLDEQFFLLHGIDVNTYKIVALKSSQHFRAGFEPLAAQIISVDSPGIATMDLASFDYQRLERPIFPLDDVSYE